MLMCVIAQIVVEYEYLKGKAISKSELALCRGMMVMIEIWIFRLKSGH